MSERILLKEIRIGILVGKNEQFQLRIGRRIFLKTRGVTLLILTAYVSLFQRPQTDVMERGASQLPCKTVVLRLVVIYEHPVRNEKWVKGKPSTVTKHIASELAPIFRTEFYALKS
jgi:hypothetical protein